MAQKNPEQPDILDPGRTRPAKPATPETVVMPRKKPPPPPEPKKPPPEK